jgi:hypothetical protein
MMELLGLLDTLEAAVLGGKKVPFTANVIVDENKILEIIDKLRTVMRTGGGSIRSLEHVSESESQHEKVILSKAKREARLMKEGANRYAEEQLNHLMVTLLKMQRTVENGKQRMEKIREEGE